MKKHIKNIWGFILKIYDRMTSTVVEASIGDIIMSHPNLTSSHLFLPRDILMQVITCQEKIVHSNTCMTYLQSFRMINIPRKKEKKIYRPHGIVF